MSSRKPPDAAAQPSSDPATDTAQQRTVMDASLSVHSSPESSVSLGGISFPGFANWEMYGKREHETIVKDQGLAEVSVPDTAVVPDGVEVKSHRG